MSSAHQNGTQSTKSNRIGKQINQLMNGKTNQVNELLAENTDKDFEKKISTAHKRHPHSESGDISSL